MLILRRNLPNIVWKTKLSLVSCERHFTSTPNRSFLFQAGLPKTDHFATNGTIWRMSSFRKQSRTHLFVTIFKRKRTPLVRLSVSRWLTSFSSKSIIPLPLSLKKASFCSMLTLSSSTCKLTSLVKFARVSNQNGSTRRFSPPRSEIPSFKIAGSK